MIEVDQEGYKHELGFVHKTCNKPIDRVIGLVEAQIFEEYSYLKDFDYKTWSEVVQKGQALFSAMRGKINQVVIMAWNPEGESKFKGKYCIKINLEDGSSRYVHHRGKIVRETLSSATEKVAFFNSSFNKSKLKGDPSCYTSNNEAFGPYSFAMKMKDENEECIECINAEVAEYTFAIEKAYDRFSNYYAPVIMLIDKNTGQPIIAHNTLFFIDNPLKLKSYIANWAKAGITLPEYKIEIIKSDYEFDMIVSKCLKKDMQLVANPLFDMNLNPISGIVFKKFEEMTKKIKNMDI